MPMNKRLPPRKAVLDLEHLNRSAYRVPITIVDYGLGNIFSVAKAFEHFGAEVHLASDAQAIESAQQLVLPGVGAFAQGMAGLQERGLVEPIRRYAASYDRPLMGICLGMQLLLSHGSEFGSHAGLGIIPGTVELIDPRLGDKPLKVPHIAWATLVKPPGINWDGTAFDGIPEGSEAYFVHSFAAIPDDEADLFATANYGDTPVCAAVRRGAVIGCQFHPEKSGAVGLRMIQNFLSIQS